MYTNVTSQLKRMAAKSYMRQDTSTGNYIRLKYISMDSPIETQLVLNSKNATVMKQVSWLKLFDQMIINNIGFDNIYMSILLPTESDRAIQRRIKKFIVDYDAMYSKLCERLEAFNNDYEKFREDAINRSKANKPQVSQAEVDAKNIKDATQKINSHISKLTHLLKDKNPEIASEAQDELKHINAYSAEFTRNRPRGTDYERLQYIQSKGFII